MAEKLFYSMGEVAEMFDVNASLIRHWESQFSVIRPKRNKKGNRLFSPQDVENLKLIYHLVKERGMTLEGAKKALKQKQFCEPKNNHSNVGQMMQGRLKHPQPAFYRELAIKHHALLRQHKNPPNHIYYYHTFPAFQRFHRQ